MANNAASVLAIARGEIGYSRWDDPEPGTKYGRWYESNIDKCSTNYNFGASGVPFCAMGVSWTLAQAGVSCVGYAGAYCPSLVKAAKAAGKFVSTKDLQPGDPVYFDWEGDGTSDHVGIVELNTGAHLQTIEYNTNNGRVARRTRAYSTVIGGVRPNYGESAGSNTKPAQTASGAPKTVAEIQAWLNSNYDAGLSVDNEFGPLTKKAIVRQVQRIIDASVDGIFGSKSKAAWGNRVVKNGTNSTLARLCQMMLMCRGYSVGSCGCDGEIGTDSTAAIKAYQTGNKLTVDGELGKNTAAKLFG